MQYKRIIENGKTRIKITVEGVNEETKKFCETHEDWIRIFDTGSFTKLNNLHRKRKNGIVINDEDAEDILSSVNYFLDWVSVEDRSIILLSMININVMFRAKVVDAQPKADQLNVVCKEIGQQVEVLNKRIGLFKKCRVFAEKKLPLKIDMNAGARPQDTKDMTYYYDDTILLAAAIIYSKLLIGIFGMVSETCKSYGIKQLNRDTLNNLIVQPLYMGEGKPVTDKMKANTKTIIKQMFGGTSSKAEKRRYVLYGHGITESLLWTYVEAALPTRLLVNINLYSNGINIVGVMHERVHQYVDAVLKTAEKNMVIERTDTSNTTDDQQRSRIELDSIISKTQLDTLVLVDYIANSVVNKFLSRHVKADKKVFMECRDHLNAQPVPYGPRNKLIVEALFGKYIGGASSCSYIKHGTMIKILAAIQLMLAEMGYRQLVYGLTAITSNTLKTEEQQTDYKIMSYYLKSEYKEFTKLLETLPNKEFMLAEFTRRTSAIMSSIVEEYTLYNIPQPVWDILGEENKNGKVIEYTPDYSSEMCKVLILEWQSRIEEVMLS